MLVCWRKWSRREGDIDDAREKGLGVNENSEKVTRLEICGFRTWPPIRWHSSYWEVGLWPLSWIWRVLGLLSPKGMKVMWCHMTFKAISEKATQLLPGPPRILTLEEVSHLVKSPGTLRLHHAREARCRCWLTAPAELSVNSQYQLPALWVRHLGHPAPLISVTTPPQKPQTKTFKSQIYDCKTICRIKCFFFNPLNFVIIFYTAVVIGTSFLLSQRIVGVMVITVRKQEK